MIWCVNGSRIQVALVLCAALGWATLPAHAQAHLEKPLAGPRATVLQITPLYVQASLTSQRIDKVQIGREMVVAEKSGDWYRVYANTDIQEVESGPDQPMVGSDSTPPPVSGWVQMKGVVEETTPNGDQIIMGAAANEEALASDPRGPVNAAQSARLLYRRVAEMFPKSPLAPEAAWRAADIQWQLAKADNASLPSSREQNPDMRLQIDETELRNVIKTYPRTRWAALADFDLLDNKLCGSWQGTTKCPEREAELYERYADEYPNGPKTARALYEAVYRMGVLTNMFQAKGKKKAADAAHQHAHELLAHMQAKFGDSEFTWRAGALVYKLDENIPVYGIDLQ